MFDIINLANIIIDKNNACNIFFIVLLDGMNLSQVLKINPSVDKRFYDSASNVQISASIFYK